MIGTAWVHNIWAQVSVLTVAVLLPSPATRIIQFALYFLKGRFVMDSTKIAALALSLKPLLVFLYALAKDLFTTGTPEQHKAQVLLDVKDALNAVATQFNVPSWVLGFVVSDTLLSKTYDEVFAELGTMEHLVQNEVLSLIGQAPAPKP